VSHNNLTTLHGELSSLPSLRVSAGQSWWAAGWVSQEGPPCSCKKTVMPCVKESTEKIP
jgi:hypothetical protein